MSETAPDPELLRSLRRLVRGLSALFWGLPAALIICAGTATSGWFGLYDNAGLLITLPAVVTGLLLFGIWQLGSFQKQERPWRSAQDRARFFALINLGISPFLYWWNRAPGEPFFNVMIFVLAVSAWSFLLSLNGVVFRLGAMLPDEALRLETRHYTALNRNLLIVLVLLVVGYIGMLQLRGLPVQAEPIVRWVRQSGWWVCVLVMLLPLAMTMALIWKTREVILDSVFGMK